MTIFVHLDSSKLLNDFPYFRVTVVFCDSTFVFGLFAIAATCIVRHDLFLIAMHSTTSDFCCVESHFCYPTVLRTLLVRYFVAYPRHFPFITAFSFRFVSAWTASRTSAGVLVPLVPRAPAATLYPYPTPPARSAVYPTPPTSGAGQAPALPSNGSALTADSAPTEPLLLVCQQRTTPSEHFTVQTLNVTL